MATIPATSRRSKKAVSEYRDAVARERSFTRTTRSVSPT